MTKKNYVIHIVYKNGVIADLCVTGDDINEFKSILEKCDEVQSVEIYGCEVK